jgi:UDP-N-acetylglucosamine 4-epimerase
MNYSNFSKEIISKSSFLITGGAGFIGSNIVECLINFSAKKVRVLDNFSTGNVENLKDFLSLPNFELINGDITNFNVCIEAVRGMDFVSHQAALGSVPRSINDPIKTNHVNIEGFLNILIASNEEKVKRFVYASSSSTYGDSLILPKIEDSIGMPLSPYAVTKYVNELYADVFSKIHGFHSIGMRYFNVFGPKQNLMGPYAAVIPLFITKMLTNQSPIINGNDLITRDFTYVSDVVQANIKSLLCATLTKSEIINVASSREVSLLYLIEVLNQKLNSYIKPQIANARKGDVLNSLADITKAQRLIGYLPEFNFEDGIGFTIDYYKKLLNFS